MRKVKSESNAKAARLQSAYLKEREQQDLIEVDLNRAHVILVDNYGNLIRTLHQKEH